MEQLVSFTNAALDFIKKSVADEKCLGLRINVVSGGCQGMTYEVKFVNEVDKSDLEMELDGVKIYIASKAVIFIAGMTVDYVKNPMGGNLVFENPNAKSKCGCGKSFCTEDSGGCCGGKCGM